MEPSSIARPALSLVVRLLGPLTTQAKFERARDEQMREWLAELDAQVRALEQRLADLAGHVGDAEERLFHRTVLRFTTEALGALTDDHRVLLAVASANVLRPDFEVETKSRIIRALNTLEPGDVQHLRVLANESRPTSDAAGIQRMIARSSRRSEGAYRQDPVVLLDLFREQALSNALCLTDEAAVTGFGEEVLRYVEQWQPAALPVPRPPPAEEPRAVVDSDSPTRGTEPR